MPSLEISLLKIYIPLLGWVGLGLLLGHCLPKALADHLGKFLFWIGVPISVFGFLRGADLSGSIWIAPLVAWVAILLGVSLAWVWQQRFWPSKLPKIGGRSPAATAQSSHSHSPALLNRPSKGSFLLSSMVGNTGYIGYPVILTLVGPAYFAWAIFYDLLGSMLGSYGLGVAIASRYSTQRPSLSQLLRTPLYNPTLWSFFLGLTLQSVPFPKLLDQGLKVGAWSVIALSLTLLGMRLSQLRSLRSILWATRSLSIKMLVVPLVLGVVVSVLGMSGPPRLIMVLQMAMPPAFATLVIAEAYDLDRDLAVTTLALGTLVLLVTLPLWLWLFPI